MSVIVSGGRDTLLINRQKSLLPRDFHSNGQRQTTNRSTYMKHILCQMVIDNLEKNEAGREVSQVVSNVAVKRVATEGLMERMTFEQSLKETDRAEA